MAKYFGLDIGGTKCALAIGNEDGEILSSEEFPTSSFVTPRAVLDEYLRRMERWMDGSFKGIGISVGGPLDSRKGLILSPPNLPGWDEVPIVDYLERRTGLPVRLENDANACALAEFRFGNGRGFDNVIFLTFGTGMGAGLILDGKLYRGRNDLAGEAGHIRLRDEGPMGYGKRGSFEGFCSGGGIKRLAESYVREHPETTLDKEDLSAKAICIAAEQGNPEALALTCLVAEQLGYALSLLTDLLNPDAIIIGSIYTRSESLFRDKALEVMERECLPQAFRNVRLLPSKLGDSLGLKAALAVAVG